MTPQQYLTTDFILRVFDTTEFDCRSPITFPCLAILREGCSTLERMSKRLKSSPTTVRNALTVLERAGFVSVVRASLGPLGKAKNIYKLKED